MSKIILAILMAAAFVYALWLVLFRRALPHPGQATGLRRRFYLATLLFVAAVDGQAASQITCYEIALPPPPTTTHPANGQRLAATLQAVWRALDPKQSDDLRQKLEAAVGQGAVRQRTADMLAVAYAELSYHKYRTRGEGARMTCYSPTQIGGTLMGSREQAFKQLELLAKARDAGAIDGETASKARAVLAGEIEMLHRARVVGTDERTSRLIEGYNSKQVFPSASAEAAAELIVQMEGGQPPALSPGARLMDMKQRVRELFKTGIEANDWQDPEIEPNLAEILARVDLLAARDVAPDHTCYSRALSPVKERSKELAELQKKLLDKHLLAGTVDGNRYTRLVEAQRREDAELRARLASVTEKDLQTFQEKAREVVRTLYERGEVPPSLVEEVEEAIGIDVLDLKPGEAIRAEVGFCLRARVHAPQHRKVFAWLEERKLIPAANNRRGEMTGFVDSESYKAQVEARLNAVRSALDKDEEVTLANDDVVRIARNKLPRQELDYRLRMRRAVRILVKNGLLDRPDDLQAMQECLGISIIGTLEDK